MKDTLLSSFVLLCTLTATQSAWALVKLEPGREFVMDQNCPAYSSIRKQTHRESLQAGERFPAIAENRQPNPTHTLLQLGSKQKWVARECGHYGTQASPATPQPTTNQCLPFFDNENNPVKVKVGGLTDITPPAPRISPFGQAVNKVCGPAGKQVSQSEFQRLLRAHPAVLKRLRQFTDNRVFADRPARRDEQAYLNDLTEAWFKIYAFDHIFCGEPKSGGAIGGLHFMGRYLQLQQSGEACRMNNLRQNEVVPGVIYSMGVTMKTANGGTAKSSIKGYGLTLSAEDILKAVTRAFAENPGNNPRRSDACLLSLRDDGKRFDTVFVRRKTGIRTFYPDATPGGRRCTQAINLQE